MSASSRCNSCYKYVFMKQCFTHKSHKTIISVFLELSQKENCGLMSVEHVLLTCNEPNPRISWFTIIQWTKCPASVVLKIIRIPRRNIFFNIQPKHNTWDNTLQMSDI
jgi:hypothetical protein